jgi:hypothetical protein
VKAEDPKNLIDGEMVVLGLEPSDRNCDCNVCTEPMTSDCLHSGSTSGHAKTQTDTPSIELMRNGSSLTAPTIEEAVCPLRLWSADTSEEDVGACQWNVETT